MIVENDEFFDTLLGQVSMAMSPPTWRNTRTGFAKLYR